MDLERVIIKFYATEPMADLRSAIDVFHGWIQNTSLDGMLIDVADYAHVPDGPGIVLIGNEADYAIDEVEGSQGFLASFKRDLPGDNNADKIAAALRAAIKAAALCQSDERISATFDASRIRVVFNDRLNQPNDEASFDALKADIEAGIAQVYGDSAAIMLERHAGEARARLTVHAGIEGAAALAELAA